MLLSIRNVANIRSCVCADVKCYSNGDAVDNLHDVAVIRGSNLDEQVWTGDMVWCLVWAIGRASVGRLVSAVYRFGDKPTRILVEQHAVGGCFAILNRTG